MGTIRFAVKADTQMATAYAVATAIGEQFWSYRFESESMETTLKMNYSLLTNEEWDRICRKCDRVLARIHMGDHVRFLDCRIEVRRNREGDIAVIFRTGNGAYRLRLPADGAATFDRVAA